MNKVGILTVTYINNYGSHLQSFALQHIIRSLGYDTEIISKDGIEYEINKRRRNYLVSRLLHWKEIKSYFPILIRKYGLAVDKEFRRKVNERKFVFEDFSNNEYVFSPVAKSWVELYDMCLKRFSTVVIGSDQNWRPANIAGGYYTAEFVPEGINKVAYATSFGISKLISNQVEKTKSFLGRIDHISVRENTGQNIVKALIGRDIPVVCDPTILITPQEWERILNEKVQGNIGLDIGLPYILCYFLGENAEHRRFVNRLKEITGLKIVAILMGECRYYHEHILNIDYPLYKISPFDFVNLIRKAQYVCTDSFHGCSFSLVFQKQFFAFYKSKKNSQMSVNDRIDTMLGWAGATNRIVNKGYDLDSLISKPIDYSIIGRNIEKMRTFSLDFLKNSLK